ncbi:hypothetical protein ACOMHN_001602 [Nucella lapillus]
MAAVEMDLQGLGEVQFGEDIRQKEFSLRPQACFLNNGSYGNVPKRVLDVQKRYLDEMESHPDHWFRRTVFGQWNEAREAVAEFLGADVEDIVFVTNSTSGVNCVLRSLKLKAGDAVMGTSLTYHSLKELWRDLEENIHPQVQALLMEVKLPVVSEDALVQQYQDYLTSHPNVKLVLIDHISSPSGVVMPVSRVAALCRDRGVMVMVDGAHAPGQLPLHLTHLGVDFYTGNMNKWMYSPRGCAVLWVKREHHALISPPSTSYDRGKSLSEQFFSQGTRDYVPFLCAKQAVQFYRAIGGMERVVSYTSNLATQARDLLATEVGLARMDIPPSMEAPNLRLLKMPGKASDCSQLENINKKQLQDQVYRDYDIQVIFDWVDGGLYLRISTQVHNTLDDFRKLVPVMERFRDEGVPYCT